MVVMVVTEPRATEPRATEPRVEVLRGALVRQVVTVPQVVVQRRVAMVLQRVAWQLLAASHRPPVE